MRISRPCYDKYHRCPGWAGGGTRYARKDLCENGSLPSIFEKPLWKWRLNRCPKCHVIVLPYNIRLADWRWWKWQLQDIAASIRRKFRNG